MIKAETQLLYSSDYPHWDFDLPSTIYDLPFLNEKAKRNILGGNAAKLFKLDISGRSSPRWRETSVRRGGQRRAAPCPCWSTIGGLGGSAALAHPTASAITLAALPGQLRDLALSHDSSRI